MSSDHKNVLQPGRQCENLSQTNKQTMFAQKIFSNPVSQRKETPQSCVYYVWYMVHFSYDIDFWLVLDNWSVATVGGLQVILMCQYLKATISETKSSTMWPQVLFPIYLKVLPQGSSTLVCITITWPPPPEIGTL